MSSEKYDSSGRTPRPVFDGQRRNFRYWKPKFCATALRREFASILDGTSKVSTKDKFSAALALADDKVTVESKLILKNYRANTMAFGELMLAIDTEKPSGKVAFGVVENAVTSDLPDGDARLAWKLLIAKFAPETSDMYLKLEKLFVNSRLLNTNDSPDVWVTFLESTISQMNKCKIGGKSDKTNTDLVLHICANMDEAYDPPIREIEARLESEPSKCTVEWVKTKLDSQFLRLRGHRRDKRRQDDNEKGMMATAALALSGMENDEIVAFMKQVKGRCYSCGKWGHLGKDCPSKGKPNTTDDAGGGGKKNGKCFHCGIRGHYKFECKKYLSEQGGETANIAQDFGESDEESHNEFYDAASCDSVDELGFVAIFDEMDLEDESFFSEKREYTDIHDGPHVPHDVMRAGVEQDHRPMSDVTQSLEIAKHVTFHNDSTIRN